MDSKAILFLCASNSVLSPMAAALAGRWAPPGIEIHSAGVEPAAIHPCAVRVMNEIGLDVSSHRSRGIHDVPLARISLAISLSLDPVWEDIPPGIQRFHCALEDPCQAGRMNADTLHALRGVRDQLGRILRGYFERQTPGHPPASASSRSSRPAPSKALRA